MQAATQHLSQLPYPALVEFIQQTGPVTLDDRYDPEPWPALVRVILGQQVSTKAAAAIWQKVLSATKGQFESTFLDSPERLEGCGLSRAKTRTLTELLAAKRAGTLDLPALAHQPHEIRLSELTPYWGIGPWSVEMWSLFHCRDPDIWSPGDLALKKGAAGFAAGSDPAALIQAARPYRSYLALYCWRAANANLF